MPSLLRCSSNRAKSTKTQTVSKKAVRKFCIQIIGVEESGTLSRKITARLTNRDGYARNVRVYVELMLDGERIKINGKDALLINVGDIGPNESVEKTVDISVGFFDGLKIKNKGYVNARLTITWDSGKEVFGRKIRV